MQEAFLPLTDEDKHRWEGAYQLVRKGTLLEPI
jgi:hypothetical protein